MRADLHAQVAERVDGAELERHRARDLVDEERLSTHKGSTGGLVRAELACGERGARCEERGARSEERGAERVARPNGFEPLRAYEIVEGAEGADRRRERARD